MAYLTPADFRAGAGLHEVCTGLSLTATEAPDAGLTSAIARLSQRVDDYTGDHFESQTAVIEKLDVSFASDILFLPRRCTAVTTVQTQDELAVLTAQTSFRFRSSLNAAGDGLRDPATMTDYLQIIPGGPGLTGVDWGWVWPMGPQTVWVTGTYGWTTCPSDIKRALALLVFNHFKPIRADLRLAETVSVADSTIRFGATFPSGIVEADDILYDYKRPPMVVVG